MQRLLFLAVCLTAPLFAQTRGVAKTGLNLRSGAGKSHGIKGSVAAGDTLAPLAPHPTTHYYHVRIPAGTAGWVWERGVQLLGDGGGPSPESAPALSDSTNWIDSLAAWSKPAPQERSTGPCAAAGAAAPSSPARPDTGTDLRKNRIDESPSYHEVAAAAILGLPWSGHPPRRYRWKHDDTAAVRSYEGVAFAVTWYLAAAKDDVQEMTDW